MNLGIEDEYTEFKKSTSELKEGVASIASILNKHGEGELFFGVTPRGDVCGQDVSEKTLRQISQAIGNSIEPRIVPEIVVLEDDTKKYIKVAFSGSDAPYSCKGAYRIRIADEDIAMTASQIESMIARRIDRKNPWDSRPSGRPIAEVNEKVLRDYVHRGKKKGRIPFEFTNTEDVLERLGLLTNGELTNAADVLFCKSPFFRLKMGILESHTRTEILDLHQESGTVFELVDKAMYYVLNNIRRRFVMDGKGPREEIPEIPMLAIKEALMNAYAHQDWMQGGCVQIDIYYDAVEILSLGWFIEGQSPDEHLQGSDRSSQSRNRLIVNTLYRSGDIESYGTGIPRMKTLCDEAGVRMEYQKTPSGTNLVFHRNDAFAGEPVAIREKPRETARNREKPRETARKDEVLAGMGKNDVRIYRFLSDRGQSSRKAISSGLDIPDRTVLDCLNRLMNADLVVSTGSGRSTEYTVTA